MKKIFREAGRFTFAVPYIIFFLIGISDGQDIKGAFMLAYHLIFAIEFLAVPYMIAYLITAVCFLLCFRSSKQIADSKSRKQYISRNICLMACIVLWAAIHIAVAVSWVDFF